MTVDRLAAVASPALRAWLAVGKNGARVDTVIAGALAYAKPESAMPRSLAPRLADPIFRPVALATLQRALAQKGQILRAEDGTRAIQIDYDRWRLERPGTYGTDAAVSTATSADIANYGAWAVEAYPPAWKRLSEVVYLDLDGEGRKVYRADASKAEAARYAKEAAAWEKAGKPAGSHPAAPRLYYVKHGGVEHAIAPDAWYGVTDATAWHTVGDAQPTRRAAAAKEADRRTLSPGAARVLDTVILSALPPVGSNYPVTATELRQDLTENRQNVFTILHTRNVWESYPVRVAFTPEGDDAALFEDAAYRTRTADRLIAASLRRLAKDGWVSDRLRPQGRMGSAVTAYHKGNRCLSRATVDGAQETARAAQRAADVAEATLRNRSGSVYGYLSTPEYRRISAASADVLAARAQVENPFATAADVDRLNRAAAGLRAAAEAVG